MQAAFPCAFFPSQEKIFPSTPPVCDYAGATVFADEAFSFCAWAERKEE